MDTKLFDSKTRILNITMPLASEARGQDQEHKKIRGQG